MNLLDLKTKEERQAALSEIIKPFKERAAKHDEEASFPFENFKELKEARYTALTVPEEYGGAGISLSELLTLQQQIAEADGSTALAVGWHMGITKHLGENKIWEEATYRKFAEDVVRTGALINNAASEPATGSPTRGGKPETTATSTTDGWLLNGRKTFTTLAPVLDYIVVSASIKDQDKVANFLVKRDLPGVQVKETWDSIAMRGTGSHDLILENVPIKKEDLVEHLTPGKKTAAGWLLHIPACYLGIARAAQQHAVEFATSYSPNSVEGTISDLPNVKQKLGDMELALMESTYFLQAVAQEWDSASEDARNQMKPTLGAVKLSVVNKALQAVDLAMRVAGARSLSRQNPLQRYYRDVRAGLHNPPMDDMTIMQLADKSIKENE
ncbi:acyl-CoA dehydrogenase family protein [Oceanobacillus manasiensis]|uniref:acyl-CoA dehydrogenase family protein n=1 Tax=Oceanobacillus manasiensis TaxID=586413 RepID=UPI0005A5F456|nr:acyl-CoA dehydrogenase family protein [Oceanobacillus manasiensis]